jgi:DNA-binding beta-propeller fold protein YncE
MNQIANAAGRVLGALALAGLTAGCHGPTVTLEPPGPALVVRQPALYPETIEYDAARDQFLLGSFRAGAIYAVKRDGAVALVVDDPRLCSVLGIAVDRARNRVWAVNSDLGAGAKLSAAGPKHLAAVAAYDLATGRALHYVDVAPLYGGPHLLNGIALDAAGNAYVSDSFSPVLYRVDADGHASVFLHSQEFNGDGINLNGLVAHPDGYLLVIKKSDGAIFKIPLADPYSSSKVRIRRSFVGGDGVTLATPDTLLIVANQTPVFKSNRVFSLKSTDHWATAEVVAEESLGEDYATTAVRRADELYVVSSRLNQLIQSPPEQQPLLRVEAQVRRIGKVVQ